MGRANASLSGLSTSMMRFGALSAGSIILIEREFGRFDKAIRHATSVTDTTERQFREMAEMALDASVQWNKMATDTAQAFYYLGSAGLTATEQMQAFNGTIMLSRAMGSELEETVQGLIDVVKAFGLQFSDTQAIADQLTKTVISANLHFGDLDHALAYVASTARLTNNTLAETNAMLGIMANAGIRGSMAGTTLRRAMTNLMSPTGEMSELIYELGLHVYDSMGRMRPFIEIMGEIGDKIRTLPESYRNMIFEVLFGRRAIAGQITLFNYGSKALRQYADEIANSGGMTEKVAKKQMKSFLDVMGQLWQDIRRTAITLGEQMAPALERVSARLREQIGTFREYITANSGAVLETMKWLTLIGGASLIFPPIILVLAALTRQFVGLTSAILNTAVALVKFGWGSQVMLPFLTILTTIYTIRALLQKEGLWSGVVESLMGVWDEVIAGTQDRFKTLEWLWYRFAQRVADYASAVSYDKLHGGTEGMSAFLSGWNDERTTAEMERFSKAYNAAEQQTMDAMKKSWKDDVVPAAKEIGDALSNAMDAVGESMRKDFANLIPIVQEGMEKILPASVAGEMKKAQARIAQIVDTVRDMVRIFRTEPSTIFGYFKTTGLIEFDQKMKELRKRWFEAAQAAETYGQEAGPIRAAWSGALTEMFSGSLDSIRTWKDAFVDTLKEVHSSWETTFSDLLNGTYADAITLKNIFEDMFLSILTAFNNMVAQIAAENLLYKIFGGDTTRTYGMSNLSTLLKSLLSGEQSGSYSGSVTDTSWYSPSSYDDWAAGAGTQKLAVAINVENTGTAVSLRQTSQYFNGRQYVINAVMEEYNANPSFRNALGK